MALVSPSRDNTALMMQTLGDPGQSVEADVRARFKSKLLLWRSKEIQY